MIVQSRLQQTNGALSAVVYAVSTCSVPRGRNSTTPVLAAGTAHDEPQNKATPSPTRRVDLPDMPL